MLFLCYYLYFNFGEQNEKEKKSERMREIGRKIETERERHLKR